MKNKFIKQKQYFNNSKIYNYINTFIYCILANPLIAHAKTTADQDIWSKASEIMSSVYSQILGISTMAAVVTSSIALILMNFSKNGKTVDESRAWLKRIILTWAILNSLGLIMAYITPFFENGNWKSE